MAIGKMQRFFPYPRMGTFVYVTIDAVYLPESCRSGYSLIYYCMNLIGKTPNVDSGKVDLDCVDMHDLCRMTAES